MKRTQASLQNNLEMIEEDKSNYRNRCSSFTTKNYFYHKIFNSAPLHIDLYHIIFIFESDSNNSDMLIIDHIS